MPKVGFLLAAMLICCGCQGEPPKATPVAAEATRPKAVQVATDPAPPKATRTVATTAPVGPAKGPAKTPRPQDRKAVREILKSRLARLSNVVAEYEAKVIYPALEPGQQAMTRPKGANYTIVRATGSRLWRKRFMRLEGRSRYEQRITVVEGAAQGPDWRPSTEAIIRTYTADRNEYLGLDKDRKPIRGVIRDPQQLPAPEIEIALGLRAHGQTDRLSAEAIEGMVLALPDDERAVLRCMDNEKFTHEWTFLRRHGYALSHYIRKPPQGQRVYREAVMGDFKEAGGMIMPHSMVLTSKTMTADQSKVHMTMEAAVVSYRIGDPSNAPDAYRIKWPVGTRLLDRRKASTRPAATSPAGATRPAAGATAATRPATTD